MHSTVGLPGDGAPYCVCDAHNKGTSSLAVPQSIESVCCLSCQPQEVGIKKTREGGRWERGGGRGEVGKRRGGGGGKEEEGGGGGGRGGGREGDEEGCTIIEQC